MSNAISIKGLGKSYSIAHRNKQSAKYQKFSDILVSNAKTMLGLNPRAEKDTKETFWALDDISFDVMKGERVGIIGRNGAGKSTMLKILSRITAPTRGSIEITGRVSSLLEVGTGFHAELTGRENIFLNGSVLGMSRPEIHRKFEEIVEFSEVEKFLDTPVKHYSSGMYMRLAFSVAAHLEPDILIVDEVLAVGDAAFQKKCLAKMKDFGGDGRTVLFVSHNMGAITEFCSRAVLLDHGNVAADGLPSEVIPLYAGVSGVGESNGVYTFANSTDSLCHITRVSLLNGEGRAVSVFELFDSVAVQVDYEVTMPLSELQMTVTVSKDGIDLFHAFDNDDIPEILPTRPGKYRVTYQMPRRIFKEGVYSLRITAGIPTELLDDIDEGVIFEVVNHSSSILKKSYRSNRTGLIASPGQWLKQDNI